MPDLLPGQMKVKDLNGFDPNDGSKLLGHPDGKIDAADRIYLGSTDPKVIIGFGNMFEYKNFDLNIFFYGMFSQYVANSNLLTTSSGTAVWYFTISAPHSLAT